MKRNVTVKELAESLNENYLTVSSIIKFLVKIGAVKEVGKEVRAEKTKGKPSTVYEVPNLVELIFWDEEAAEQQKPVTETNPISQVVD